MCPLLMLMEPVSECFMLGMLAAWATNFLFRWDPLSFFLVHVLVWFLMDWALLHVVQVSKSEEGTGKIYQSHDLLGSI